MSFEELKRALAAEAQAKGICSEWYSFILRATSKERLLTLFVKGLDFVFDNDFPSAELRAEFKGLHEHYGVFIDEPPQRYRNAPYRSFRNIERQSPLFGVLRGASMGAR